jgi:hypothetical protein
VSLYDGLGGPPIFCGLLVDQRRVVELKAVDVLFSTPVIVLSLIFGWCWRYKCCCLDV